MMMKCCQSVGLLGSGPRPRLRQPQQACGDKVHVRRQASGAPVWPVRRGAAFVHGLYTSK